MDLRAKTCCFTGHRSLSGEEKMKAAVRLRRVIEEQIKAGIVFYGAGGARGVRYPCCSDCTGHEKRIPSAAPDSSTAL